MIREEARKGIAEIYESLENYRGPIDYSPPATCDGYSFIIRPTKIREVKVAGLHNGVAALYSSNDFVRAERSITPLYSNRFIFPDNDISDVRYFRQAFFHDEEPASLRGFEAISSDGDATDEVIFVNNALKKALGGGGLEHVDTRKLIISKDFAV